MVLFSVDGQTGEITPVPECTLSDMGFNERSDLEEWLIDRPDALGEELLMITSEFDRFQDTNERLDLLALDKQGKLVVVELKRDHADRTTDLQAIKYASYCSTLTAQEIQEEYRTFRRVRDSETLSERAVGEIFTEFLSDAQNTQATITDKGWADFELDNQPRILLAAGSFGTEVTSPVMWLNEEYGLQITCTKLESYEQDGDLYLSPRQIIPVPEAEEYMTRRRHKENEQGNKEWNGRDFYVQFGHGKRRSWADARKYGFVSAGHGDGDRTFSKLLEQLEPGHRVWTRIPGEGYVGVGEVTTEATPVRDFSVKTDDGEEVPILEMDLDADMGADADDLNRCEYLVGVDWIETRDIGDAVWETGMWYFRREACPIYEKNRETLDKLVEKFEVEP